VIISASIALFSTFSRRPKPASTSGAAVEVGACVFSGRPLIGAAFYRICIQSQAEHRRHLPAGRHYCVVRRGATHEFRYAYTAHSFVLENAWFRRPSTSSTQLRYIEPLTHQLATLVKGLSTGDDCRGRLPVRIPVCLNAVRRGAGWRGPAPHRVTKRSSISQRLDSA
jgi:hypothetical protein